MRWSLAQTLAVGDAALGATQNDAAPAGAAQNGALGATSLAAAHARFGFAAHLFNGGTVSDGFLLCGLVA